MEGTSLMRERSQTCTCMRGRVKGSGYRGLGHGARLKVKGLACKVQGKGGKGSHAGSWLSVYGVGCQV